MKNFIAKGSAREVGVSIQKKIKLENIKFDFFFDKSDFLIKNIFGLLDGVEIKNGDVRVEKGKKIKISSNFETLIDLKEKNITKYFTFLKNLDYLKKNTILKARFNNNLNFVLDKTYKIQDYQVRAQGKIKELQFFLNNPISSHYLKKDIKKINFRDTNSTFKFGFDKKNLIDLVGKYQINNSNFQDFNFKNNFVNNISNIDLIFKFSDPLEVNFINFKKDENSVAEISSTFTMRNNTIFFKNFHYRENKNNLIFKNLKIKKNQLSSFKQIQIKTFKEDKLNNEFSINFGKSIVVKGTKYDATNLNKILNQKKKNNFLKKISKNIDISLDNIQTPLSEKLLNFKLIGTVKNGEFVKISSKGDFGNNKHLDISLKNDNKNKKYLEIYCDIPQALLSEYSFFKGLSGGILTFTSIIERESSTSKLIIEDFKIVNAPGVVKLLSLADFGGLADLAEGEGLSFEKLDLSLSKDRDILKLNELYAVGPSISVLMEGYQEPSGLTSLRGTLVPAKNLNNLLSKIPVIGDIIIPKEVGEGLFGVSFKMKGPPGKIKTTINPIKTLTPRFISKALEKNKKN